MNIVLIALPAALLLAAGFVAVFIWCVRSGQLDDTTTPPTRMLFEDEDEEQ